MARTKRKKSPTDSELNMIAQMLTLQQHMAERWDIPSIGQSMEDFVNLALPLVKNPPIPKRPAVQQPVTGGGITSSNMEPHGRSSTTANPILNLGPSPSSSTPVPSSVPSRSHQVTDFPTSTLPIVSDAPPAFSSLSRTVQNVSEEGNETARGGKDKETTGSLGLGNLDKKLENGESTKNQQYHLDLSNTFTNGQSHNIDRRILPGNIGDRQKLDRKMAETTKMAEKTKMVEKTIMAEKTKQKGMGDEEEDDEDETEERENYTEGTEGGSKA